MTFSPPDDTKPQLQQFSGQGPYLYYDYQGIDGNRYTLTFDINAMAWVWDINTPAVVVHASFQGASTQGVLAGCGGRLGKAACQRRKRRDGHSAGSLSGDWRQGYQHCGMLAVEYSSTQAIALQGIAQDANSNGSYGTLPIILPSTVGKITKYFLKPSPNTWKLLSWQFTFTDQTAQIYTEGCMCYTRSWGSSEEYEPRPMFSSTGGEG